MRVNLFVNSCFLIALCFLSTVYAHEAPPPAEIVKKQILALGEGDSKAAYDHLVSDEFMEETPFQLFEKQVQAYPLLMHFEKMKILRIQTAEELASVEVLLEGDGTEYWLDYTLIKKKGMWKIRALMLTIPDHQNVVEEVLLPVIEKQLKALREEDFLSAYHNFTSEAFQRATPFDRYQEFVLNLRLLREYDLIHIKEAEIDGPSARLELNLIAPKEAAILDYTLIKREDTWKIDGIELLAIPIETVSAPKRSKQEVAHDIREGIYKYSDANESGMSISQISFGTVRNKQGRIVNPTGTFPFATRSIFVNVEIKKGIEGTQVELDFEHVGSSEKTPTISTTLLKGGDQLLLFVYSLPEEGWPDGIYEVTAFTSTGIKHTAYFMIEKPPGVEDVPPQ